jgi:glutamate dehydrogenase/leucine dehydrogenase
MEVFQVAANTVIRAVYEQVLKRNPGENFEGKVCTVSGSGNVTQYTTEKLNQGLV